MRSYIKGYILSFPPFKGILAWVLLFAPLSLWAQYNEVKESRNGTNRPYTEIPVLEDAQAAHITSMEKKSEDSQAAHAHSLGRGRGRLLNFDWRFQLGNPEGAEREDFDDSQWRKLDLPHDFQFEQPWDEQAGGARGFKGRCEGWYRKTFTAPEEWKGLQVLLDIEGLMYYGDVYINGNKVASSEYGYLGFETDLSKHLHYGSQNTIAIYANSGKPNASRWYTGAGLFRNVHLRLQNPTHIGRHGIYVQTHPQPLPDREGSNQGTNVTTPSLSGRAGGESAIVNVCVDVCGFPHGSAPQPKTTVRATVTDANHHALATTVAEVPSLTKHNHDEIALPAVTIENPTLWDLDNPYLYNIEVELYVDDMLVDFQTDRFGIRTIEYSPKFGFKLNGRKVFLKGMANHHDMGALGVASYDDAIRRQFRTMKEFGFNALRCSHNPYAPSLTRIADEEGMLIVDELIDKWSDDEYWGGRKPFMQLWPSLIREWITRDRNCPSVVLWSLGNELQIRPNWSGYDTNDWGITTYRVFDQMVKRYDRTRPTTVAMFPARAGAIREEKEFKTYMAPPELAVACEVSSFNYQWDCYPKYFEYAPDMILFQSEAVTNQMQAPFYGMDRQRTVGLAYWGAIEYWGESNKWPKKGWNFSFFRHTLQPNPQAWLIRGAFRPEEPIVRIGVLTGSESLGWNAVNVGQKTYTEFWNYKEDSKQQVTTFTNCEEVELILNGKWVNGKMVNGESLGRQKNDTTDVFKRGIIKWNNVPYGKGGSLTAIAYKDGKEVARHRIETAGKATRLVVEPEAILSSQEESEGAIFGMGLRYLTVRAVDKHGNTVPSFDEPLTINLEGTGYTLLALDNGDHYTDDLFLPSITTKRMYQGQMQVILRSTRQGGKTTLSVTTPSLKAKTNIETK